MVYAPVIIWTLNRYEHLKCCIESLEKNRDSKETEVYISVDYPPEGKYVEGYNKVKTYLQGKKFSFKRTHIFFQEKNLGPLDNYNYVVEKAFESFDRLIMTEDDNEFSPYFLEYMNYLLNKYERDDRVFAIGGFSYPIEWKEDGKDLVKLDNIFSAWGSGIWKIKYEMFTESLKAENIDKMVHSFKQMMHIFLNNPGCFGDMIHSYLKREGTMCDENGNFAPEDVTFGMYIIANDKYIIIPKVTQVINHGNDGSGIHCTIDYDEEIKNAKTIRMWNTQEAMKLDEIVEVHRHNHQKVAKKFSTNLKSICSNWVQYLLFRLQVKKRD